jgi:hypothetical protein
MIRCNKPVFFQQPSLKAEGKLRSKALFRREGVAATSARSELLIADAGNGRLMRYRTPHAYATIQRSKTIQSP